jgi:hypothetical protein
MYRSSVSKFIQGVLSLLDEGRDLSFDDIKELKDYTIDSVLSMLRVGKAQEIRDGMPPEADPRAFISTIQQSKEASCAG